MKVYAGILLAAALAGSAFGQGGSVPFVMPQYFTNGGLPNASGTLCTYASGTSTPAVTYSDAALSQPNQTCITLNSAGRPQSGGIFLGSTVYRFVLKDSAGVTIWTQDGVAVASPLGTGPWSTSGTSIYSNVSGGKVCISSAGNCTTALSLLNVQGASSGTAYLVRIDDSANSPGINLYGSGNSYGSYAADSTGLRLRDASGTSQMTVSTGNVTVQNAATSGSTNLLIQGGASQGSNSLLTVNDNSGTTLDYIDPQGNAFVVGLQATGSQPNQIQAPYGGVTGKWLVGTDSLFLLEEAQPPLSANGQARIYADSASHTLLVSQNGGTYTSLGSGGGGGGTPGGANTQVQYNNLGNFGGSPNFTWNNASQLLTVTASSSAAAGIAVATGFMQADAGFLANQATATNYNAVQAPGGGMAAKSFTATKYVQVGTSSGAPSTTTGDTFHAGALYWDTGSSAMQVYNGSGWVSLGGGSGSPGGSDTDVQYNSTGSFAGSTNFTWNNANQLLTVTARNSSVAGIAVGSGFVQADAGFLATVGTATAYNAIQAPGGGMAAKSFTATKYVQAGFGTTDPAPTTSDSFNPGAIYWNTSSGQMKVYNGSSWVSLTGSGGSPGGSNGNIQFNSTGTFGGSSSLNWNTALSQLTVTAPSSASAGIAVGNGYVQADAGFYATAGTATNYNAIQAPGGGVYAKSFHALNYTQVGSSPGTPATTFGDSIGAGAMYYNTSLGALQVYNGSTWVSLSGGGGSGVTSAAGTTNQVYVNGGVGAQTGAVTLSLPQSIGTGSTPTFAGVVAGAFNSTASGSSIAFQTSNFNFQVDGSGNISGAGQVNLTGSGSVYKVSGTTVINTLGQFVGSGVNVGSNGVSAGNFNVYGGYIGQTWNIGFSQPFTINGGGSYTTLIFRGGILVSAQ